MIIWWQYSQSRSIQTEQIFAVWDHFWMLDSNTHFLRNHWLQTAKHSPNCEMKPTLWWRRAFVEGLLQLFAVSLNTVEFLLSTCSWDCFVIQNSNMHAHFLRNHWSVDAQGWLKSLISHQFLMKSLLWRDFYGSSHFLLHIIFFFSAFWTALDFFEKDLNEHWPLSVWTALKSVKQHQLHNNKQPLRRKVLTLCNFYHDSQNLCISNCFFKDLKTH